MIKGVNRQVVEVNETNCEYFEKIMFFVKPEYISVSESKIRETAGRIAGTVSAAPKARGKRNRFFEFAKLAACVLLGSAVTLTAMGALM